MGWIQEPNLVTLGQRGDKPRHAVSFAYDFSTDSLTQQPLLQGKSGTSFQVNIGSLNTVAQIPAFRALQFTANFDLTNSDSLDGQVVIYVPSTQQSFTFASPIGTIDAANVLGVVSGYIPIVGNAPTVFTIAKGEDKNTSAMFGRFSGTLFDFDVPTFVNFGVYQTS